MWARPWLVVVSSLLEAFGPPVFDQMQAADQTKLATLHCAELSACAQAEGDIAKSAEGTGIGLAYPAKVSLASGWTVGTLLELAGSNLPEPATPATLLEGMWTIQDN